MTSTPKGMAATLTVLAAMAAGGAPAAQAQEIGLAVANLQSNFFNQIKQSVEAEAKVKGVTVDVVDAHGDSATQVSEIQDLITKGIRALIYIPAGATAAGVPVQLAHEAHIPVIAVDRNAPNAPGDTFIATDSVSAAHTLGDYVCRMTGGKGNVAIIQGQLGTTPELDRDKGFSAALAHCPGLTVVAKQASQGWHEDEGFAIAQDMLQRDPGISVFFGRADALALGAAQAVKVANLGHKVFIVGFDGDSAGLLAVKNGTLAATMTQKTRFMGRLALDSALELVKGVKLPPVQLQPAELTTAANVDPLIANHP